ncbi:MAG: alpha-rhamnosidase, partial [Clostridia bacterium]|nr:alpha-rhamnosidase [Clostridia bacterium]
WLFDFGKEIFGKICIDTGTEKFDEMDLFLGESYEEAIDTEYSHLMAHFVYDGEPLSTKPMAFRYVFIPTKKNVQIYANLEYLPLENRGSFRCDNEGINKLWDVCAYTMLLNSREGFFDGIKRDRWVWSGDAYQSYLVNYYLACDKDIVRRTVRMLRGSDPIKKHINTICDYTFLWICSIWDYYFYTGDKDFLCDIYPDMLDMMSFIEGRLGKDKMYERKSDDWVFIDWSTFDSNGPMCAEQMVLTRAYECLGKCANLLGDKSMATKCKKRVDYMKEQINLLYWNEEKGAFIDDYNSGKNNVTRHANIFALLFDYTTEKRKEKITKNVIFNKEITPITTPYFEFYELDAMCQLGNFEYFTDMLDSYWGGMLRLGATTIWEEFDPTKSGIEHYTMYGGKYEKSLCHAWGASPIYLLGKYALGVVPTKAGFESYTVTPNLMGFGEIEGKVPTPNGEIYVKANKKEISVLSPIDGGTLVYKGKKHKIKKDETLTIKA